MNKIEQASKLNAEMDVLLELAQWVQLNMKSINSDGPTAALKVLKQVAAMADKRNGAILKLQSELPR